MAPAAAAGPEACKYVTTAQASGFAGSAVRAGVSRSLATGPVTFEYCDYIFDSGNAPGVTVAVADLGSSGVSFFDQFRQSKATADKFQAVPASATRPSTDPVASGGLRRWGGQDTGILRGRRQLDPNAPPGAASGDFCDAVKAQFAQLSAVGGASSVDAAVRQRYFAKQKDLNATVRETAPSGLRTDLETQTGAGDALADARLRGDAAATAAAITLAGAPETQAAGARITAYVTEHCGSAASRRG